MKTHQLLKGLLMGVVSLSMTTPLLLHQQSNVNAAQKWITITTNRDQLLFNKPGSTQYKYSNHNKGLKVRNRGIYRYHHRLYYRVNVPEESNKTAYILASQTNLTHRKRNVRKVNRKGYRHHNAHHYKITKRIKRTKVIHNHRHAKVTKRHNKHFHAHRINNLTGKQINTPGMSSEHWYTTASQSNVSNLKGFNNQVKSESLNDINQDRANNGENTSHYVTNLKRAKILDKLADIRAKQSANNFSHFEAHRDSLDYAYFKRDAKKLNLNANNFSWGENIARTNSTANPSDIADQINYGYMNKDAQSDWSHRNNILNSDWTHVGIGSYHNNLTNETYQAELFTGK